MYVPCVMLPFCTVYTLYSLTTVCLFSLLSHPLVFFGHAPDTLHTTSPEPTARLSRTPVVSETDPSQIVYQSKTSD
jgi:hypothetical protein